MDTDIDTKTAANPAAAPVIPADTRIPVTVLTGYLGAGKTTLLNRILSGDHGRRYAVIVNEFGEIGIDGDLIIDTDEELFEMSNGCICCTVRGDLIRTLHGLLQREDAAPGRPSFDAIIIETTGLADPGPVAQTFFVDPLLRRHMRLDSVTTVVDARHIPLRLADSREAHEQIAFADQILLNKIDLVDEAALVAIEAQLRSLNSWAQIHRSQRSAVALTDVLGRSAFDLSRIELAESPPRPEGLSDHRLDDSIRSVSLRCDAPMDADKLGAWLKALLATQGANILRAKGIIDLAGEERRLVVQAVHMLMEGELQRPWRSDEPRHSRLVFIGRQLDGAVLQAAFEACAARPDLA